MVNLMLMMTLMVNAGDGDGNDSYNEIDIAMSTEYGPSKMTVL